MIALTVSGAAFAAERQRRSCVPQDAILSDNLIGLIVMDGSNKTVGGIKDLASENGKLTSSILSVGGFLGMSEHDASVHPSSVSLGYDEGAKK